MTMFNQTSEYALRAMISLARIDANESALVKDIAEGTQIPQHYLGKILGQLVRARLLTSTRGRGGGFQLARPAADITLLEIIEPFEQLDRFSGCILGRDMCTDKTPCPLHNFWKEVRDRFIGEMQETTLHTVASFEEVGRRYQMPKSGSAPKPSAKPR